MGATAKAAKNAVTTLTGKRVWFLCGEIGIKTLKDGVKGDLWGLVRGHKTPAASPFRSAPS